MAKCDCNEPKVRIVKRLASDVQIETRENGFVVKVGKPASVASLTGLTFTTGFTTGFITSSSQEPREVIKYEGPAYGQEYVFGDFAGLSHWLRENIRHGKPAKA